MLPKGEVEGLVIFGGMWSFVISVSFIVLFCFRFARTVGKRKETHNLMSAFFLVGCRYDSIRGRHYFGWPLVVVFLVFFAFLNPLTVFLSLYLL